MSTIQYDNSSNTTSTSTNFSSISWTHTVNTIDNTILIVGISWRNSGAGTETVSSVTYNNNSCTLIRKDEYFNSASKSTALYYIINPASGSNTIQVTFDGNVYRAVGGAVSLTGVDQSNPINTHAGQAGGSGLIASTDITPTLENTWLVDVLIARNVTGISIANAGQTARWNFQNSILNSINGAGSTKLQTNAETTSMSWTLIQLASGWSHSVVAISPIIETISDSITFQASNGNTGTSLSINVGTPGNNRLIIVVLGDESSSGDIFQGTVSIGDKVFTQAVVADNPDGAGNHLELHTIEESTLGSISGTQTISYNAGNSGWAIHALVFYGVQDETLVDYGIEDVITGILTVPVENISSNDGSLIVMAAGNGSSGSASNWTSPLIERTDGPNPSSAVLATASGIETTGQTNKTYSVNIGGGTLRSTGIVVVFDPANLSGNTHQMML